MAFLSRRPWIHHKLPAIKVVIQSRMSLSSVEASAASSVKQPSRKKELVINTKWEERSSNPLYSHLVYSSEVDVALTAKRGKAWLEMKAAETFRAENDRRFRERNALREPTPVILSHLYGGSNVVQGEEDVTQNQEIVVHGDLQLEEGVKLEENYVPRVKEPEMLPYNVFTKLQDDGESSKERIETVQRRGRRGRRDKSNLKIDPDPEIVDQEYDIINDSLNNEDIRANFTEDHLFKHGTADPDGPSTKVPCGGCGAHLHCRQENIPGFLPSQLLEGRTEAETRSLLCQRCYFIQEYKVALKVTVSPEDYPESIRHIKDKSALILLVVDLLDFPGSVWPGILALLGANKKIIIVGNKLDLIVPDSRVYQKRITNIIRREFMRKCWDNERMEGEGGSFPQVVASCCVSATTGLNIEKLIEMIFDNWKNHNNSMPGDIYIVGCTNVGKSSLFNSLLDSDLCNVVATNRVQKAMISPVPGTTLNLLKFPLSRPEPHFLQDRRKRIFHADKQFWTAEESRLELLSTNPRIHFAIPSHYAIKHTLEKQVKNIEANYINSLDTTKVEGVGLPDRFQEKELATSKYCYDSPGTVSKDQVINLLTAEEISATLATSPLRPRTFLLKLDQTILLGGIGRLDYVEGPERRKMHPLMVTVFCCQTLPINILETVGVEKFLNLAVGTKLVNVPSNAERKQSLPHFLGRRVRVEGAPRQSPDWWYGACDIVLSSSGWVMISARPGELNTFIAYTPGGKGITSREPFLPFSVSQRGKRVQGSPKFRNDNLKLTQEM